MCFFVLKFNSLTFCKPVEEHTNKNTGSHKRVLKNKIYVDISLNVTVAEMSHSKLQLKH